VHEFLIIILNIPIEMHILKLMKAATEMKLLNKMKPGVVYRRKELESHSKSVDRDLAKLCSSGEVTKVAPGLYVKMEKSRFGSLPPRDKDLVRAFLGDNRFLLMSYNHYNTLGLGLTQLRGDTFVYNRKRHTKATLGSRNFVFKNVSEFPNQLSREYLLVDLLNNLENVGESPETILRNLDQKKGEFDRQKVGLMASRYGKVKTKNYLKVLYGELLPRT